MKTAHCRLASTVVGLFLVTSTAANADMAGQQSIGSTNYVNGGLNFIGDMNVATFAGNDGLYAMAIDPTTGYVLAGSSGNSLPMPLGDGVPGHADSLLSKVKLNAGGAFPTLAGNTTTYHDDPIHFGNISGAVSMAIDTGSGLANLSDHYAYVGASSSANTGGLDNGAKILKVQLFPPDASHPNGNPDAAPKVVSVYSVSGSAGFAAAVDQNYAYFLSGTTIKRVDLHLPDNNANKVTTITGLPNLVYYKADLITAGGADTLVVQALGTGIVEINVAADNIKNTGGVLSLNTAPTVLPIGSSAPGAFVADPTQPYAYTGASSQSNQILNANQSTTTVFNSTLTKTNLSTGQIAGVPLAFTLPSTVPANQYDHSALSLTAIDPDSHAIIVSTDNNLPGDIAKFVSGGNSDASPALSGAIQMPFDAANYNPPNNNFPYRGGDVNVRDVAIDPKSGYVYFGTDTNTPHLLQVQYSQKGSIKGDRISLPAGANLTSVNFYSSMPAPPSASSSGNVRLAIYGDNSGAPGSLIWQSGDIADNVPGGGVWLSLNSGLPANLSGGNYWLAWQVDSTLNVPSYIPGVAGSGFEFHQAFGSFPASLSGAGGLTGTSDQWSMYVAFNVGPKSTIWNGGGGDNNWSTASNWNQTPVNGDNLVFAGATRLANTNNSLTSVGSITFDNSAESFTLSGNALTITGGITNSSIHSQSIGVNLTLGAAQQFNAASGNLMVNGTIANGGNLLTVTGASNTTLAGDISGNGGLMKSGSGALALLGNNSYSGGTTVNTGTLVVGHVSALGTGSLTISNIATTQLQPGLSVPVQLPSLTIAGGSMSAGILDVTGDANLDGTANDTREHDLWSAGFTHQGAALSTTGASAAPDNVQAVPEPGGVLLAVVGAFLAAVARFQIRK